MGSFVDEVGIGSMQIPEKPKGISDGKFVSTFGVTPSSPWSLVENRFNASLTTATAMQEKVDGYLNSLNSIIAELSANDATYNKVSVDNVALSLAPVTTSENLNLVTPDFNIVTVNIPDNPDDVDIPSEYTVKDALLDIPTIENSVDAIIVRDSIIVPTLTDTLSAPSLQDILDSPVLHNTALSVTLPEVPTFVGELDTDFGIFDTPMPTILPIPIIDMSELFNATMPDDITAAISWFEEAYDNSLYTPLFNRLIADLQFGASGIGGTIEQEIYDRAQARQNIEENKQQTEIEEYFSSTGFDLPTGAMAARLQEHANGRAMRSLDLNGKIMIEQADLAQKNNQFVIEAARSLESVLRDYSSKKNDRSLDYAKAVAANAIAIYAENVKGFVSKLEANKVYVQLQAENLRAIIESNKGAVDVYMAEAQVYETTVNAKAKKNTAITDVFKAEVTGYAANAGALTDVFKTEVQAQDSYNSAVTERFKAEVQEQSSINSAAADIYKSAVQEQSSINQALTDLFQAEVQAQSSVNSTNIEKFKAEVQEQASINTAKIDKFKAQIQQQDSINSSNVANYDAKVDLYSAKVNAGSNIFGARANIASTELSANVEKYKADIDGKNAYNKNVVDAYRSDVAGYEAETQALLDNKKNILQSFALKIQDAENELKAATTNAGNAINGYSTEYSLREKVAESMANVAMQAMASAYGAVNASAGLSYNGGESVNESWSHNESRGETWSHGESLSANISLDNRLNENHSYEE